MTEVEEKKSTHKVEVVRVNLEDIPGSDFVGLARVHGYTCVTNKEQWRGTDLLAAYLPPDSLVDVARPEFSFLARDAKADGKARIKAKRLRGVLSFGLLVPAPEGSAVGDDVSELLGVEHYDPAVRTQNANRGGLFMGGEAATAPDVYCVKYDLEAGRRYAKQLFEPGEPVVISEKIHGANARYVFHDGRMHCGSRTEWKKEYPDYGHVTVESLAATGKVDEARAKEIVERLRDSPKTKNLWWQALDRTPALREFCERNPGTVVYGEVYGAVQDLNYGRQKGEVSFAAFDLMRDGRFLDYPESQELAHESLPWVPVLSAGYPGHEFYAEPFDFDRVCELAEGKTLVPGADHVREGVVVRPVRERRDDRLGRVVLKWVSAGYLERAK